MKTIILWLVFFIFIIFSTAIVGVHISVMLQPAAAIMIFGPVLLYLVHRNGMDLLGFAKRIITGEINDDDVITIDRTCSLGYLFGGVSVTMGLIRVMANLSDTSHLGTGIAAAFVSLVYAAVPTILLFPVMRYDAGNSSKMTSVKQSAGYMLISFLALTLCIFVVLYAMGTPR